MPTARRRLRPLSCLAALLLLAALLAGLEGALRLLGIGSAAIESPFGADAALGSETPLLLPDDELPFRLAPHAELLGFYALDRHGWRGPDVEDDKPAGTLRLLATGDSTTFGLGVPADAVWTAVLARLLQALFEDRPRIEVISAGVPSYSSLQNLVQVRRDLPPLHPDALLLLATGHNDAVMTAGRTDAEELAAHAGPAGWLRSLALSRALHLDRPSLPAGSWRPRVALPELRVNLSAIAALARSQGTPLLLVVPEHAAAAVKALPAEGDAEQLVADVAAQEQVASADCRPAFAALAPREPFLDGIHPDADGHRLIAFTVAEALVAEGGVLGGIPRARFARAWLASRREGVAAHAEALLADDVPARFAALRERHADAARDAEALASRDRSVKLPLVQLAGEEQPRAWAEGLAQLITDDPRAGSADERADAARAAAEIRAQVAPRDPLAAALAGARDDRDRQLARASADFEDEVGCSPERRDRRMARALAALRMHDDEQALAALDAALVLNERWAEAHFRRGLALDRLSRHAEAEASWERAIELQPDSATGQFLRAKSAFQHGRRADAEPGFRAAIALDPAFTLARYALGQLLLQQGRLDEAEGQLRIVAALAAGDFTDVPALLATIAAQRAMAQ